ncbi:MAG TPA: hypothetical protein VNH11_28615 [Pirellulales bacterium]|nr:hypothetical protein [Pirellulales bacterium]
MNAFDFHWFLNRLAVTVLSVSAVMVSLSPTAHGADGAKADLPAPLDRILGWFPENTETIVVAQSFKLDAWKIDATRDQPWDSIQRLSLGDLPSLEDNAGADQLVGREVSVAINGGREFEVVSAFGSLRYQGCSVAQFKDPLPDAGQSLVAAMRRRARQVRSIAGTEVFVFPDRTQMESLYKQKPWQGQFIALPATDLLLCGTSDEFLAEVLKRLTQKAPAKRALPAELPEWNYVDRASPAWSVRHVPPTMQPDAINGLTWCLRPRDRQTLDVTYIPTNGERAMTLAKVWEQRNLGAHPSIKVQAGGTISVRVDIETEKPGVWYPMVIYWSMGTK